MNRAAKLSKKDRIDRLQARFLILAASMMLILSISITISPAIRARSWNVDLRWGHWTGFLIWCLAIIVGDYFLRRYLPERDPFLFPLAAVLSGWGLLTIWRLLPEFGLRQSIWLAVGVGCLVAGLRATGILSFLQRYKYLWLTGGLVLTGLTLLLGTNPSGLGPRQWLGCCGVYLQPSEPLKLLLIVYLAAYLANQTHPAWRPFSSAGLIPVLLPTIVMAGLALLLLIVQRDLGTASILLLVYAGIIYLATDRRAVLLGSIIGLAGVSVWGYLVFDVVRLRVDTWLNPWADSTGQGFQIVQSLISIASGEMLGRGPGLGNPALVPLSHSDFIFTAIAEESGLIGSLGILLAVGLLVNRGLRLAMLAQDEYRRYLAGGLTLYLAVQSLLIIGGNVRLLPLTGVTLPFVSYGGSSLVTTFLVLLLLLLISAEPTEARSGAAADRADPGPSIALGLGTLVVLTLAALLIGWWAVLRGPDLLARPDNPRAAIADFSSPRGRIYDRRGELLASNQGGPGELSRFYAHAALSPVIGYTHLLYGQAGLEASLDSYLRGLESVSDVTIWENRLLYGQHPPGLDVRLSLDLELNLAASQLLAENNGSIVLLNADSGEILVMISHPYFDPNNLETGMPELLEDLGAPLVNRATQGAYPPGSILGALIYTGRSESLPVPPLEISYEVDGRLLDCSMPLLEHSWGALLQAGCPGAVARLGSRFTSREMIRLFSSLGLFTPPAIRLPAYSAEAPQGYRDLSLAALGEDPGEALTISPLQLALAMATLSNDGVRPAPRLLTSLDTDGWMPMPLLSEPQIIFSADDVQQINMLIDSGVLPIWETSALGGQGTEQLVAWYAAGTDFDWPGAPVVVVVALESGVAEQALEIGRQLMRMATGSE